jgi:hypothetical protein
MLIVSIDPRASEKSIAQISRKSTLGKKKKKRQHKGKLGNRLGDENSGELAHTIRVGATIKVGAVIVASTNWTSPAVK